jgi:deoxyribodipyrimidine photolyase-related protein
MNNFIILPNQLFDKKYLDKDYKFIIWEHPHYFKDYKYNKKKLLLHKGSMKYYFDYLKKNKFSVKYIDFDDKFNIKEYKLFDPINKLKLPGKYEIIDSPNFLLGKELTEKYRKKTDKFFFHGFYMWCKKELDILPKVKSQDKYNRDSIPDTIKLPKILSNKKDNKYINIGKKFVEKEFSKNYGNTDNFIFPLTHETAKKWLKNFVRVKLKNFGKYQDAIKKEESYMFHSLLSSSINIGLLNPDDVIEEALKYKSKVPLNSLEGFIRQLFWREYQKYCYIYYNFNNKNYFGNKKKLTKAWYDGTTGIEPIDDCIKKGFDTAYLHHIERLMVMGNYMNLYGLHPNEGFKWFMEFSIDSYEWVMHQNVYDMVFFVSGGATMRRPYISSSNYVLKMSNYKKGEWSIEWDNLYNKFLKTKKKKLWKFRYYFRGLK